MKMIVQAIIKYDELGKPSVWKIESIYNPKKFGENYQIVIRKKYYFIETCLDTMKINILEAFLSQNQEKRKSNAWYRESIEMDIPSWRIKQLSEILKRWLSLEK